jgi:hypothetical protein
LSRPTQWVLLAGEQLLLQQAAQEVGVRHLRLDGAIKPFLMDLPDTGELELGEHLVHGRPSSASDEGFIDREVAIDSRLVRDVGHGEGGLAPAKTSRYSPPQVPRVTQAAAAGAVARPSNLDEMTEFARRLANDFPFVRVDFYAIDGQTLFGEMTWYPLAGEFRFVPESYDRYWGEVLQLPARKTVKRLLA